MGRFFAVRTCSLQEPTQSCTVGSGRQGLPRQSRSTPTKRRAAARTRWTTWPIIGKKVIRKVWLPDVGVAGSLTLHPRFLCFWFLVYGFWFLGFCNSAVLTLNESFQGSLDLRFVKTPSLAVETINPLRLNLFTPLRHPRTQAVPGLLRRVVRLDTSNQGSEQV